MLCTEGVFQAVATDPRCLLTWEKPHTVFAKGFGNVPAYFMRTTDQHPPKELMLALALEPRIETFIFEGATVGTAGAVVPTYRNGGPTSTGTPSEGLAAPGYIPSSNHEDQRTASLSTASKQDVLEDIE